MRSRSLESSPVRCATRWPHQRDAMGPEQTGLIVSLVPLSAATHTDCTRDCTPSHLVCFHHLLWLTRRLCLTVLPQTRPQSSRPRSGCRSSTTPTRGWAEHAHTCRRRLSLLFAALLAAFPCGFHRPSAVSFSAFAAFPGGFHRRVAVGFCCLSLRFHRLSVPN